MAPLRSQGVTSLTPGGEQQLDDGDGGGAGAVDDDLHVLHLLAHHLQGVGQARQGDDGGAVLVVVEDGDVAALLQLALDLKAPGGGDVLQVHAAEGAGQQGPRCSRSRPHPCCGRTGGTASTPPKALNSTHLPLHDGHAGLRADVAQPQTALPSVTTATVFQRRVSS